MLKYDIENIHDMNQALARCYFLRKNDDGTSSVVYAEAFHGDDDDIRKKGTCVAQLYVVSESGAAVPDTTNWDWGKFDVRPPPAMCFNILSRRETCAFSYAPSPRRQWRKGLAARDVVLNLSRSASMHIDNEMAYNMFMPKYHSVGDAAGILSEDHGSVALSPRVWLMRPRSSKEILVGYKRYLVGKYDDGRAILASHAAPLKEQIGIVIPVAEEG